MSYVIDVYRRTVVSQKNILKLALYITLFPQLIAGPIVRYKDIAKEIDTRKVGLETFASGIERFVIGLSKKVILSNILALAVDQIWAEGAIANNIHTAWLGCISYALQIYFDFSGYSDMAIGLGKMFGFHFCENFNLPYISKSISEFWRRWHISLSTWFKDYVYIPLGGNRKNVYLNLAIVFLLTGIWHGASWTYIIWGCWNGFFIVVERIIKNKHKYLKKTWCSELLKRLYTMLVILIGWVLFRAPTISDAIIYLRIMFGHQYNAFCHYDVSYYLNKEFIFVIIVSLICSTKLPLVIKKKISSHLNDKVYMLVKYTYILILFLVSSMKIVVGTYNPFIYFQF